jgi:hypothetical protein
MGNRLGRGLIFSSLVALLCVTAACNKNKNTNAQVDQSPAPFAGGGPGRPSTPVGEIMTKLGKGPQSLTETIGRELKTDPPPWDAIQPQTKEYAQLAASMSQYDPPRGSKESWAKQTASFSESAAALDRAADSRDKNAALAAHGALTKSCMACHREHRAGPGGRGRSPGGPPPGPQ